MDLTTLRAFTLETQLNALGVDAIVTPVGGGAIATKGIWLPALVEDLPVGQELQRREPRRVMGFSRAVVGVLARGSAVVAVDPGGTVARTWRVEGTDRLDGDQHRVVLAAV